MCDLIRLLASDTLVGILTDRGHNNLYLPLVLPQHSLDFNEFHTGLNMDIASQKQSYDSQISLSNDVLARSLRGPWLGSPQLLPHESGSEWKPLIGVKISSAQLWLFVVTWGIKNECKFRLLSSFFFFFWNTESHVCKHLFLIRFIPLTLSPLFHPPLLPPCVLGQTSCQRWASTGTWDGSGSASARSNIESRFGLKGTAPRGWHAENIADSFVSFHDLKHLIALSK